MGEPEWSSEFVEVIERGIGAEAGLTSFTATLTTSSVDERGMSDKNVLKMSEGDILLHAVLLCSYSALLHFTPSFYSILYQSILFTLINVILFHIIPFHSISFYSISFHSISYHSILFHSMSYHSILYYSILYHSIQYHSI